MLHFVRGRVELARAVSITINAQELCVGKKHFRTCHLCETMCGIEVEYEGRDVIAIRGDKDDVLTFPRSFITFIYQCLSKDR